MALQFSQNFHADVVSGHLRGILMHVCLDCAIQFEKIEQEAIRVVPFFEILLPISNRRNRACLL
jgi:hypothetical protein